MDFLQHIVVSYREISVIILLDMLEGHFCFLWPKTLEQCNVKSLWTRDFLYYLWQDG